MTVGIRGSGRTTKQIKDAPKDSFYVWCNQYLRYPKELCTLLGRDDITVISQGQLKYKLRGTRNFVVLDHDTRLNSDQYDIDVVYIHNKKAWGYLTEKE